MSKAQILIHRYFDAAWKQGRKGIGYSDTQLPEHKELILYVFDLEHRLAVAEDKIPRWIPVSEALPPYFESVLAIRKNCTGRPYYATMYRDNNWCDIVSTEVIDVTHWMPLPEVPESGKGEG